MLDAKENIIHGLIFLMLGFLYDMTFYREVQTPRGELSAFQTKTEGLSESQCCKSRERGSFFIIEIMTAMK